MTDIQNSTTINNVETPEEVPKKRRGSDSFASIMQRGVDMASGISEHLSTLSPKLDETTVERINTLVGDSKGLNAQQEILKGQLKEKTSEVNGKVKELKDLLSECQMIVKAVMPQERWVDFGIGAKK
jgi:hypothetical protein